MRNVQIYYSKGSTANWSWLSFTCRISQQIASSFLTSLDYWDDLCVLCQLNRVHSDQKARYTQGIGRPGNKQRSLWIWSWCHWSTKYHSTRRGKLILQKQLKWKLLDPSLRQFWTCLCIKCCWKEFPKNFKDELLFSFLHSEDLNGL